MRCVSTCPGATIRFSNPTTGRDECIVDSDCPTNGYYPNLTEDICEPCFSKCLTCSGELET